LSHLPGIIKTNKQREVDKMLFKKYRPHSDGRLRKVADVEVRKLLDKPTLQAVLTGRGAVYNSAGEIVPLDYKSTGERLRVRFF
jgi:hypothetical protein